MVASTYFVEITPKDTGETYIVTAGKLSNALQSSLGNPSKFRAVTHTTSLPVSDMRVEVEITAQPTIARAVVQAEAPAKFPFDKNLFTKLVRASSGFDVKVSKRAVDTTEDA